VVGILLNLKASLASHGIAEKRLEEVMKRAEIVIGGRSEAALWLRETSQGSDDDRVSAVFKTISRPFRGDSRLK
jgi:hypothetical protein